MPVTQMLDVVKMRLGDFAAADDRQTLRCQRGECIDSYRGGCGPGGEFDEGVAVPPW